MHWLAYGFNYFLLFDWFNQQKLLNVKIFRVRPFWIESRVVCLCENFAKASLQKVGRPTDRGGNILVLL
jgi:hypothetical protein